jgi:hypothetical protein
MIWQLLFLLLIPQQASQKALTIVNSTLHQIEDGPPIYSDHKYIPGETVFFSFQVSGYQVSKENNKVDLSYRIDAVDSQGVRLVKTSSGKVEAELAPQDKDWMPKVRLSFIIPPYVLPGKFQIQATIKDELSGRNAKTELPFEVQGRDVKPSDTLVVRNFGFLRREDDTRPLPVPAYQPGNTMWARFDITGYKLGEQNHISVSYSISIENPAGKIVYTQPQPAIEEDTTFYPKRYTPGLVSLNIQPGTPAGEYAVILSVQDQIGNQTCETRQTFRIE